MGIIKPDEALGLEITLSILSVVLLGLASNLLSSFIISKLNPFLHLCVHNLAEEEKLVRTL